MITCIIIIILITICLTRNLENFEVVGYNNINVPDYKIVSVYDTETTVLQNIFTKLNTTNPSYKSSYLDNDPTFKVVNNFISFPFTKIFKTLILEYLKNSIVQYNKDKVYILGNFNNIYYKDQDTFRIFVFNFNLVNPVNFFTRNIKIRIRVNNIKSFMNPNSSYMNQFNDLNIRKYTELEYIILDQNAYPNFKFKPINVQDYYVISNKYHLMDPFVTSGKDFIITDDMKKLFQLVLNDKRKSLSTEYDSYSQKNIKL